MEKSEKIVFAAFACFALLSVVVFLSDANLNVASTGLFLGGLTKRIQQVTAHNPWCEYRGLANDPFSVSEVILHDARGRVTHQEQDSCLDSNTLVEHWCGSATRIDGRTVRCEHGCVNADVTRNSGGYCRRSPPPTPPPSRSQASSDSSDMEVERSVCFTVDIDIRGGRGTGETLCRSRGYARCYSLTYDSERFLYNGIRKCSGAPTTALIPYRGRSGSCNQQLSEEIPCNDHTNIKEIRTTTRVRCCQN